MEFEETRDDTTNWSESELYLSIQPAGSNVLIKYQPEGNVIINAETGLCTANCPIITGYQSVTQAVNATRGDGSHGVAGVDLDPNLNYYVSIYVAPSFDVTYGASDGDPVTITCGVNSSANCQEGDAPKGYASDIALVSTKSIYADPTVGIDYLGNLFGLPLVFIFVIGLAAVFTGKSAQMGIIFIAATLGIMGLSLIHI